MRLAILSDLHVEFEAFEPPAALAAADVVVLAGDIHNGVEALHWARRAFARQRIVQVAGNHEFYGDVLQPLLEKLRAESIGLDIDFLEAGRVEIDGIRFLGATLWTDFELYAVPGRPRSLDVATAKEKMRRRILDFAAVRFADPSAGPCGERPLDPDDTIALHRATRRWLEGELDTPFDGPTVVVSHHLPSLRSVAPAFHTASTNTAFASDLDALVARADLWIHGHTHHGFDYRLGPSRVVANPRGYPMAGGGYENPGFDPALIVTVGGDPAGRRT